METDSLACASGLCFGLVLDEVIEAGSNNYCQSKITLPHSPVSITSNAS